MLKTQTRWGKIPILTNIFQVGWNHQPVKGFCHLANKISPQGKETEDEPQVGEDFRSGTWGRMDASEMYA